MIDSSTPRTLFGCGVTQIRQTFGVSGFHGGYDQFLLKMGDAKIRNNELLTARIVKHILWF